MTVQSRVEGELVKRKGLQKGRSAIRYLFEGERPTREPVEEILETDSDISEHESKIEPLFCDILQNLKRIYYAVTIFQLSRGNLESVVLAIARGIEEKEYLMRGLGPGICTAVEALQR
jgi:hypothetical protein